MRLAVSRTAVPTGPPGDAAARTSGDRLAMTMVKVWQAGVTWPLVAQTVVGPNVPARLGVPVTKPAALSVSPVGSVPAVTENVGAGSSAEIWNWWT